MRARPFALAALLLGACELQPWDLPSGETGDNERGRTLVLTTTDHATGALVSIDTETHEVVERALASSDAIPYVIDDLVYVVNRFGFDYVDIYDPERGWERLNQIPLALDDYPSTNPQAVAKGPEGELYVTLYGAPSLLVLDAETSGPAAITKQIDLSEFADADGIAESTLAIAGPEALAISVQQIDRNAGFQPVGEDRLVIVDYATQELIDLNPNLEGVQGLTLPGSWPRQTLPDPASEDHAFILTTGILRLNHSTRSVEWAVPESAFIEAGIGERLLPQSFAIDDAERRAYIAAYDADFTAVSIYRAPLDGSEGLTKISSGHHAIERTLAFVGGHLWFGTTSVGEEGMLQLDIAGTPLAGPLDTGLPPYSLTTF